MLDKYDSSLNDWEPRNAFGGLMSMLIKNGLFHIMIKENNIIVPL